METRCLSQAVLPVSRSSQESAALKTKNRDVVSDTPQRTALVLEDPNDAAQTQTQLNVAVDLANGDGHKPFFSQPLAPSR
jgi:hypothetical protein